jgi:CheY-like chemotaxis protein
VADVTDRARILLVDDRPENLLALEAILGPLDQTLVRANSGEEALRALLLDDYALILLDARMPGMDGFETAARIKGRDRSKDVPIIFLTAVDTDEHLAYRGYAAGAADYLTKPFDPWLLRAKVQVFVDLWRTREQLAAQGSFLRRQLDDPSSPVDVLAGLDVRLADVEAAVAQLGNETGPSDALTRVERRLQELRSALGALSSRAG